MFAIQVTRAGRAELQEVGDPTATGDDVLVELELAALNPVDDQVVAGLVGPPAYPRTLGIEGVGRAGDQRVLVFGRGVGLFRDGTLAERVAVPASATFAVPEDLAAEQAVACGAVGATAVRLCALADPGPDDRVLVLGGSGACGAAVTSLLQRRGVPVVGQTSTAEKAAVVETAGGEAAIVQDAAELGAAIGDEAPSIVIDALGGDWTAAGIDLLAPRGRLVLYATGASETARLDLRSLYRKSVTLRGYSGLSELPNVLHGAVVEALASAAAGDLRIPVAERISLPEVPLQLAAGSGRRGGKVIVGTQPTTTWS